MLNRRMWKIVATALLVAMAVASLGFVVETSEAQGPGGNGRGGGNAWSGQGARANAQNGLAGQNCTQDCVPALDGTGTQLQYGNGAPMGGQWGNSQGMMLRQHTADMGANLPPASTLPLSDAAQLALVAGLQDEVNAYATYQAVIDQLGAIRPFTSIQTAEAQHMAALEYMFERYGLAVPVLTPTVDLPQFASAAEACAAAAAAEIASFGLYDQWLASVSDYPDLVQVFTALKNASEFSHLPAFERCAG